MKVKTARKEQNLAKINQNRIILEIILAFKILAPWTYYNKVISCVLSRVSYLKTTLMAISLEANQELQQSSFNNVQSLTADEMLDDHPQVVTRLSEAEVLFLACSFYWMGAGAGGEGEFKRSNMSIIARITMNLPIISSKGICDT